MLHPILPGKVVAQITLTEEDIFYLWYWEDKPKNWQHFIEYLSEYLADALSQHVYDEMRHLYFSYLQQQEECPHRHTTNIATGGYHYAAGEVWDDLREVTVCLDCGKQIEETEPDLSEDAAEALF